MDEILLDAQPRKDLGGGKLKDLRRNGFVPAVVYSAGKKSQAIQVSHRELMRLIHHYHIESVVINLNIKENKDKDPKAKSCLIKEIQYNPVSDDVIHVDFNEISLTKAIKVNVAVVANGEPIGVKQEGGSLEHILWEIEIECLPRDIPKEIPIDVSQMKIGDAIHIKDIVFPANVKVLADPEAIVLTVIAPIKEEEVAPLAEGEGSQEPEVIREKKEAAEGEEGTQEKKEEKKEKG